MTVRVLLFASYAESLGRRDDGGDAALARHAWGRCLAQLRASARRCDSASPKPLCARNLAHAGPEDPVTDGDEIAILPPLAGG